METKIDHTIQYGQTLKRHSEYKYTKVIQNTGGDDLVIGASTQSSTFEIPVVGFNLAKSRINFIQNIPAAAHYTAAFRHTPPWSRVELFTRGGTYLMDVTNFSHIYTAFGQRTKKIEDFHGDETGIITKSIPAPAAFGTPIPAAAGDPATGAEFDAAVTRLNAVADSVTAALQSSSELQLRMNQISTDSGDLSVRWSIKGSELYNTIMSLDKTLILGEVLNLRITWLQNAAHGFTSDDGLGATNPANIINNVSINKLAVYLAQESNASVLQDLSNVISTDGMQFLIPYTHAYKTTLPRNTTSHAISVRLSRGHGISLARIYTLFGSGAEEKQTRYEAKLSTASPVVTGPRSFYSLLNSRRVQEFDIDVEALDYDWMKTGEKKDRVVSLSIGNDQRLFAHSDGWAGTDLESSKSQEMVGLSLAVEQKYDLYVNRGATAAAADANYYTAAVCQKQLMVGPGGVQVM